MDYSPSGSSVQGILQARILEWVRCPSPRDLSNPGIEPTSLMSPALLGRFFTTSITWEGQEWLRQSYKEKTLPTSTTFHFHALEKEMATHSSVLAWRISGMGSHRVRHDWSDLAEAAVLPITTSMHSSLSQNYMTMYFCISSNVSEEDARLFAATEL